MAIIKIVPNKPLTISLKFPSPIEKQGKWGLQYLYTLSEPDALIYLPPIAHDEIQKLHAGPGEPFTLTKTIGQGNQAVWKVERLQRKDTESHAEAHKRIYRNQPSGPANVSIPSRPDAIKEPTAPKSIIKAPVALPIVAPLSTPQSKTLLRQLIAAIEVTHAAKIYAEKLGMNIEFTGTDIRALAITGGIQVFKEGVY